MLTRVGRPTCFVIMGTEFDETVRNITCSPAREAQRRCRAQYLDTLEAGSVIPCTVTHIENFGAFCDIGCGICGAFAHRPPFGQPYCLSRRPSTRGQQGANRTAMCRGRIVLTLEPGALWAWSENAACFAAGETVGCIVQHVEDYGVFIEEAPPNLGAGPLAGSRGHRARQAVKRYIKNILPDDEDKAVVVNKIWASPLRFVPQTTL